MMKKKMLGFDKSQASASVGRNFSCTVSKVSQKQTHKLLNNKRYQKQNAEVDWERTFVRFITCKECLQINFLKIEKLE